MCAGRSDSSQGTVCQLLLKYRHHLMAYVYSVLHDYHAAEDVFQEISIVAMERADTFEAGTDFAAWARTIGRNKLREHLRRRREVLVDEETLVLMERAVDRVHASLALDRRKQALRSCLGLLEKDARRLLSLRYEEGFSPQAIAESIRKSRAAANSLLQRVRERLRACVKRRVAPLGG